MLFQTFNKSYGRRGQNTTFTNIYNRTHIYMNRRRLNITICTYHGHKSVIHYSYTLLSYSVL